MKCIVAKAFDYGHDGVHVVSLAEGDTPEIRDELVDGLVAAGFLKKPKSSPDASAADKAAADKAAAEPGSAGDGQTA